MSKTTKFLSRIKDLRIVIKPSRIGEPGKEVKFSGVTYETDDKEVIEKIKKSPMFGVDIFEDIEQEPKTKKQKKDDGNDDDDKKGENTDKKAGE